jgi:HYR domain/Secretion system C-terminal sorting domain
MKTSMLLSLAVLFGEVTAQNIVQDSCAYRFVLQPRVGCGGAATTDPTHNTTLTFTNAQLQDGIILRDNKTSVPTTARAYFARGGTNTPPPNNPFSACAGNWIYFTANGHFLQNQPYIGSQLTNVPIRLRTFGNAQHPDSIHVEIAGSSPAFYTGKNRTIHCNSCVARDIVPPTIQNCPTRIVDFPVQFVPVVGSTVARTAGILPTDNCGIEQTVTFPHTVKQPRRGQIFDYQTITHDKTARQTVCNYKVRYVGAPCENYPAPVFNNCPTDITVTAAPNATCATVSWTPPTLAVYPAIHFNPIQVTGSREPGSCFPIGTSTVVYHAMDSCYHNTECRFSVTVSRPFTGDTCFAQFEMADIPSCNGYAPNGPKDPDLQLVGRRLIDGFSWNKSGITIGGTTEFLYARNGSMTAPAGSTFTNCAGNWVYFTASGGSYGVRPERADLFEKVHVRIKAYGNERNPDSVRVEFANNDAHHNSNWRGFYRGGRKTLTCNQCFANDQTPPMIKNCPTQIVNLPFDPNHRTISRQAVLNATGITATDNCNLTHFETYPFVVNNVTNGQLIDFKTVAYDQSGNKSVCAIKVKVGTTMPADTCVAQFSMNWNDSGVCNAYITERHGSPTLRLNGQQLKKGFSWYRGPITVSGTTTHLYAQNGTITPPAGVIFNNCAGNWVYFKAYGVNEGSRPEQATEYADVHVRVKVFGTERDPDSLRLEFAHGSATSGLYHSGRKATVCNSCTTHDVQPPTIRNCPTQITTIPLYDGGRIFGNEIAHTLGIQVGDNCGLGAVNTHPHLLRTGVDGQIVDFKTVAYDRVGNKSVCAFKGKLSALESIDLQLEDENFAQTFTPNAVYPRFLRIRNRSKQVFTNIRIKVPFPKGTSSGGAANPWSGTWHEICESGQPCYEWRIPQLDAFGAGVLELPIFIPKIDTALTFTMQLLTSTPIDNPKLNYISVRVSPEKVLLAPAKARLEGGTEQPKVPVFIQSLNPNPTDGALVLNVASTLERTIDFDIYNSLGQRVFSEAKTVTLGDNNLVFDVQSLPTGVYFIQPREQGTHAKQTKFLKR